MKKITQLTLVHLNFYYPYLRKIVESKLIDDDIDYNEDLLMNNIRLTLNLKMKNQKELKKEIDSLMNSENIKNPEDCLF